MHDLVSDEAHRRSKLVSRDRDNSRLAVFVHGFGQHHLNDWGSLPEYLEQRSTSDTPFCDWDYFFFGYDNRRSADFISEGQLLKSAIGDAQHGRSFFSTRPYSNFALIAYSLGCIITRQYLVACRARLPEIRLHSITFFNPPNAGSLLSYGSFLAPLSGRSKKMADALKPQSPQLRMLEHWTASEFHHHPWPSPRILYGIYDPVILNPAGDSVWEGDQVPTQVETDHDILEMLQPEQGPAFQIIRDQLR